MNKVNAETVKYIKLGRRGAWERLCLGDGTLRFGYPDVPHDLALDGDIDRLRRFFLDRGDDPKVASSHANQIHCFYHAEPHTLWITVAEGFVWWCFSRTGVEHLGGDKEEREARGARLRHTVDGWRNTSLAGRPLRVSELNGRLTKVAAYQMTICNVEARAYLLRRINDEDLPEAVSAKAARSAALDSIRSLLKLLTWKDFELLVDLVFAQSGWRRIGATGGSQKTVDLEFELPSTGERAFAQVKSSTNQAQLDDYVERLAWRDEERMFFVYHSGPRQLTTSDPRVVLIGPSRLADMVFQAGLFDWLLEKAN